MKWFFGGLGLLLILLVVAVLNIPASVVPLAIDEVEKRDLLPPNAPKFMLENTEGTLWDGRANNTRVEVDGALLELGTVSWQLDMVSLLKRNPTVDLQIQSEQIDVVGTVSAVESGEVTVRGLEGRLPIAVLEPWFPMLVTGEIAFVVDHLVFTQRQLLSLDGLLNLEYVDWIGADYNMPLGSYMATLTLADNNDLLVLIDDFAAQLGIDGTFRLSPNGVYTFDATLEAREGLAPEVAQSITWLGKIDRNGNVLIEQRGRL